MTTTQGDRQPPGASQGVQPSNPPAEEVLLGSGRPAARAAVRTAEKARSGRQGPRWVKTVLRWLVTIVLIAIAAFAYVVWRIASTEQLPEGFAKSNGRIEATEVDADTKLAGRIVDILVDEGDFVSAGQVVAHMDTETLQAELRESQAKLLQANSAVESARSTVAQRESEKAAALSRVRQREAEFDLANKNLARGQQLVDSGGMSKEDFDTRRASLYSAQAAVDSAKADVAASDAAIATAKSFVVTARANAEAAQASIERIRADINDSTLKAPRDGRVQYRVAQPGEVLSAGGKVLNMVDLGDVYMTFFLPTDWAGRVKLGADVRLVLDAAPQFVIPARATFVADVAQFTPKTVETAQERQKLTFRIKAKIDKDLLKAHIRDVKTGLPGVAYVQLDPRAEWPTNLRVRLPE